MSCLKYEDLEWWNSFFPEEEPALIVGVDEAGYGCLAGSMFVAAVVLNPDIKAYLKDSKKISKEQRAISSKEIYKNSTFSIVEVTPEQIDAANVFDLRFEAAKKAATNVINCLENKHVAVIMDGNKSLLFEDNRTKSLCLAKGDAKSASIAAASILAKVAKDKEMATYEEIYPQYGFGKHQGYFTKSHFQNVCKNGLLPIHRRSFISEEKWSMIEKL